MGFEAQIYVWKTYEVTVVICNIWVVSLEKKGFILILDRGSYMKFR